MCEYCEKQRKKYPDDKYGIICPELAGETIGRIINKTLLGEQLSKNQSRLSGAFIKLARPTFCGVPL